jgi:tellurite methyltransferase
MEENSRWKSYLDKTKSGPPRPLLVEALQYVENKNVALDLGAGSGVDTAYLLSEGFKVTAVDSSPKSQEMIEPMERATFVLSKFADFKFAGTSYDLVNAQFALPFNPKDSFEDLIQNIKKSLRTGGVFTGQFFGPNDQWNTPDAKLTFTSPDEAKKHLEGMEILKFEDKEYEGQTALQGPKHWHVINFIAKNRTNLI